MSAVLSPDTGVVSSDVRVILEKHEDECVRALAEVQASLADVGPDDVLSARAETLQRTLDDIHEALALLRAGRYGRCTACGDPVPSARLGLRPYAVRCVPCAGRGGGR